MTKRVAQGTKEDLALWKKDFLTPKPRRSFQELVATFTNSPFLVHFDAKRLIRLKTFVLSYAISEILSRKEETEWKVVAYFSLKMIDAERNYEIHDAELLAIVESSVIFVTTSSNRIVLRKYSSIIATYVRS